jgi:hypothetical protein
MLPLAEWPWRCPSNRSACELLLLSNFDAIVLDNRFAAAHPVAPGILFIPSFDRESITRRGLDKDGRTFAFPSPAG